VALLSYTGLTVIGVPDNSGDAYVSTVALLAAFWAVGDGIRLHRAQVAADLRAAQRDAVAAREEAARATSEERLRIARELHDVVAHSMSLIAVHAGVGAHLIRTKPDQAEHVLEVIADTSREALLGGSLSAGPRAGVDTGSRRRSSPWPPAGRTRRSPRISAWGTAQRRPT
jgi:signal transduction histidine kinase